jgi:hypothetical protein
MFSVAGTLRSIIEVLLIPFQKSSQLAEYQHTVSDKNQPFTDEAQTAVFKAPVRTAL